MRKNVYCPLDLDMPKRKRIKPRMYVFTFYFTVTDSEGSDYNQKTFTYYKPVKYKRAYRDFLDWLKTGYIPFDFLAVECVLYDIVYPVNSVHPLFVAKCFDESRYCPF